MSSFISKKRCPNCSNFMLATIHTGDFDIGEGPVTTYRCLMPECVDIGKDRYAENSVSPEPVVEKETPPPAPRQVKKSYVRKRSVSIPEQLYYRLMKLNGSERRILDYITDLLEKHCDANNV